MARTVVSTPPVGKAVKYCDEHICARVCVFVCLFASISPELHVQSSPDFSACFLCPWLGPAPMAALRYVMYVRFYGRRHVCTWWPGIGDTKRACNQQRGEGSWPGLTPRHILKLTHQRAALTRRRSDIFDCPVWQEILLPSRRIATRYVGQNFVNCRNKLYNNSQ